MGITEQVLTPLLRREPARPLITHYDDADGSRVELSVITTANWAAKTANWLRDEADVEPGDPVAFALPAHWQSLGILLGVWWVGAAVTVEPAGARVAFTPRGSAVSGADMVAEVSLHPMGLGLRGEPMDGAVDFIEDSRVHGDDFVPFDPADGSTLALGDKTVDETLALAQNRAASLGVGAGSRVLSTAPWTVPDGIVDVLAVLAAGGSLVHVTNADTAKLDARADTEHVTLRLP
jgi:uncharacterized protein (TIGR03089 family)